MSETGRRLYVERQGGIRNSCPLYTTIGEASGRGGALPIEIGGVRCYAPLCSVGASESIGAYVERPGGVRMAIANTGSRPYTPQPTPPTPPTPPKPRYSTLSVVRLSTNLLGSNARDISIGNDGTRVTIDGKEFYYWTTAFHPVIPEGTKEIVIADATGVRSIQGHSGMNGLSCAVPQTMNIRRITASQLTGNFPTYNRVSTVLMFHDINGRYITVGGIILLDMSNISNIANGFYKRRVLFDVTCLG